MIKLNNILTIFTLLALTSCASVETRCKQGCEKRSDFLVRFDIEYRTRWDKSWESWRCTCSKSSFLVDDLITEE